MSPLPSVARELAGSIVVFVEPSKNLVQTSLPFASSLRRPTGSGALGSEKSAMVVPDGSVAIATTPAASLPLPTVETQPPAGGLLTLPSNAAPICRSVVIESSQVVAVPAQAPVQPANVEPVAGVALKTTLVPSSNCAVQVEPQSIPAGLDEMRPAPAPDGVTVTLCLPGAAGATASKVTKTLVSATTLRAQPPRPVHPPPQPANCQPGSGTGVRTICVPSARIAEQVVPQSVPPVAGRTFPEPLFDTVRKCCATGPGSGGGTLWDPDVPDFPPHAAIRTATPTTAPQTTIPFRIGLCSLPIQRRSGATPRPRSGTAHGRG